MRDMLFRNIGLKILSFLLAVSLWLFVNLKATEEIVFELPVQWHKLPDLLEITNPVNDFVRVRVSGPRKILSNLDPKKFPIILDLSDAKVGLRDYQITDKMVSLIPGLTTEVLQPDTIQFKFELLVTKEVSVKAHIVGDPPEGYALTGVEVKPERVEIVGAQSEVQSVQRVMTEAIHVGDLCEDTEKRAKIVPNRPHIWAATGQEEVTVYLSVSELDLQKVLRRIPVRIQNGDGRYSVQPSGVDVILEGPAGKIMATGPEHVIVVVNVEKGSRGAQLLPVSVLISKDGVWAESRPAKVLVSRLVAAD